MTAAQWRARAGLIAPVSLVKSYRSKKTPALSGRASIGDLYWMLLPHHVAVGPRVNYRKGA